MEVLEKLNIFLKKTRKIASKRFLVFRKFYFCSKSPFSTKNTLFTSKTLFFTPKTLFSHQNDISTVSDLISRVIHRREKRMDKCQRVDCLLTSLPLAIFPTERTRPCVIIANTHHSLKTHARILTRTFTYTQF